MAVTTALRALDMIIAVTGITECVHDAYLHTWGMQGAPILGPFQLPCASSSKHQQAANMTYNKQYRMVLQAHLRLAACAQASPEKSHGAKADSG